MPTRLKVCPFCGSRKPGRPRGTTKSEGYKVSCGRPTGTTETEGYKVSGGRLTGTTESEGYGVGKIGGRPTGTIQAKGFQVKGQGRPDCMKTELADLSKQDLPSVTSGPESVNLSEEMLR